VVRRALVLVNPMTPASPLGRFRSARGAVLIQVATVLLTFTMLSAFVIDFGMIVVSRTEIQTAADSAALAGAIALAFDNYTDVSSIGPAATAARTVARANRVWKEAPSVTDADVTFPFCLNGDETSPTATWAQTCVQVEAFRNAVRGNALPSYVGRLMGITAQGVAARAVAQARAGNSTDCIKPLAVPDRWSEGAPVVGGWLPGSTFEKWNPANPNVLLNPRDLYTAPGWDFIGTGLTISVDLATPATLKPGTTAIPVSPIAPWRYLAVQIPLSAQGNDLRANINQCARARVGIGDRLNLMAGAAPATVATGLQDLINRDPGASWNAATKHVDGSCADAQPRCASFSPRIIALPVYDVNDLADRSRTGATSILVRNIVGFFVDTVAGNDATGHLVQHPGLIQATSTTLSDESTFLRASLLVK
jgi:hypothetical protein